MKTYPRYFVGRLWKELDAYMRFDSQHSCVWVRNDGKEHPQPPGSEWDADKPDNTWDEVTFDVAQARLLPEARPLRWVENCKPDKPGIWAMLCEGEIAVSDVNESEVDAWFIVPATRCYIGPIPEILPPKRKAVMRLWLERLSHEIPPMNSSPLIANAVYAEHWCLESKEKMLPANWIRTDETLEVEQ